MFFEKKKSVGKQKDKLMKVVHLKWRDHESTGGEWISKEDFEEWLTMPLEAIDTVGFLVYENDEFVVIAQTITPAGRMFSQEVTEVIKILISTVVSRTELAEIEIDLQLFAED